MWGASEFVAQGSLKNFERENELIKIKIPTLFICGEYDEARPKSIKRFAKRVKGSQVEIIKGASHAILGEKPKEMLKIVANFLECEERD